MSQTSNKPNDFAEFGCNVINVMLPGKVIINTPFYRYGGHIELIRCPGGMSTFRLHFKALFGTFFRKVF